MTPFERDATVILRNMALERRGFWRKMVGRWFISDEPLRHDAANCLARHGRGFGDLPEGTQVVGHIHQKEPDS